MIVLLYSAADGYHNPQPLPVETIEPELTITDDGEMRRYVLEPTRDAALYGGDAVYREVTK